jgi:hypothetical protein
VEFESEGARSAEEVFLVAACDARVKAIVAQCQVFGAVFPDVDSSVEGFAAIREIFESCDVMAEHDNESHPLHRSSLQPLCVLPT